MERQTLNVTINLNGLRGELHRSLQKVIYLVSAGLQNKDRVDPKKLQLPSSCFQVTFDGGLKWDSEEVNKKYDEWVLSNGFRDAIEDVSVFLVSAHRVLSFWKIAEKQKNGVEIKGSDWNEIIEVGSKKFHRLGLPDKLSHIEKEHTIIDTTNFSEQILSINRARNCMVHRNGVVTELDTNIDNALEIKWTKLLMVLKNEDGEKELVLGEVIEKDSLIGIRNQEKKKLFNKGDRIIFTAEEFADICWCLLMFGENLVNKIKHFGTGKGFITEAVTDRP